MLQRCTDPPQDWLPAATALALGVRALAVRPTSQGPIAHGPIALGATRLPAEVLALRAGVDPVAESRPWPRHGAAGAERSARADGPMGAGIVRQADHSSRRWSRDAERALRSWGGEPGGPSARLPARR